MFVGARNGPQCCFSAATVADSKRRFDGALNPVHDDYVMCANQLSGQVGRLAG